MGGEQVRKFEVVVGEEAFEMELCEDDLDYAIESGQALPCEFTDPGGARQTVERVFALQKQKQKHQTIPYKATVNGQTTRGDVLIHFTDPGLLHARFYPPAHPITTASDAGTTSPATGDLSDVGHGLFSDSAGSLGLPGSRAGGDIERPLALQELDHLGRGTRNVGSGGDHGVQHAGEPVDTTLKGVNPSGFVDVLVLDMRRVGRLFIEMSRHWSTPHGDADGVREGARR